MSLADRKECRTNTTGFGPEWRSNTWRRMGSNRDWLKKNKNPKKTVLWSHFLSDVGLLSEVQVEAL